jgi:hypothetical protein
LEVLERSKGVGGWIGIEVINSQHCLDSAPSLCHKSEQINPSNHRTTDRWKRASQTVPLRFSMVAWCKWEWMMNENESCHEKEKINQACFLSFSSALLTYELELCCSNVFSYSD